MKWIPWFSRVLNEWEKQELVKSQRQRVVITFPHGLVSIAEDLPIPEPPGFTIAGKDLCDFKKCKAVIRITLSSLRHHKDQIAPFG